MLPLHIRNSHPEPLYCDGCGHPITRHPITRRGAVYCDEWCYR